MKPLVFHFRTTPALHRSLSHTWTSSSAHWNGIGFRIASRSSRYVATVTDAMLL
jgi:hypothetical protein